jgi:hypothetical protein
MSGEDGRFADLPDGIGCVEMAEYLTDEETAD